MDALARLMFAPTPSRPAEQPAGREIENDPGGNPCFGCGPDNPHGLHLRFFDDGEVVRAPLRLDERFAGWPGYSHMGIIFVAMTDTGGWAVWERLGPSRIDSDFVFRPRMPPKLGALIIEARVAVDRAKAFVDVRALANDIEVSRVSWHARAGTPEEAKQMLQFPGLPRSLKAGFEARAAERSGSSSRSQRASK